ncbi:hypothetical protein FKP32DRAFT_1559301 [Trametes sanguinea]|nr:hypothetical protein FKP32DRAFT_1559301 [Trametes sanguinea]
MWPCLIVAILSIIFLSPLIVSVVTPLAGTQVSQPVQEHVEQAIRIALESATQRRNLALIQDGARAIPRLTTPNDSGPAPEGALQSLDFRRPSCWSFPGNHGQLGIRLSRKVIPTYIALDMAYPNPTEGKSHAPRHVIFWGVVDGDSNHAKYEKVLYENKDAVARYGTGPAQTLGYTFIVLADFEYDGTSPFPLQAYRVAGPVVDAEMVFGVVVVEVRSNWGGERTAICGVRVHGEEV